MLADEAASVRDGLDPLDAEELYRVYSKWRETADDVVLEALGLYGTYLVGQTSGMSDALSLPAVIAMCDLLEVPKGEREDMTQHMLLVHQSVMKEQRRGKPVDG